MGLYDSWQNLKQQLEDEKTKRDASTEASITPEERSQPADTFRNQMIGGLGLPNNWQNTVADEKRLAAQPQPVEARSPILEMSAGPEVEGAELAMQGAQKLAPELQQWAQMISKNPNAPIEVAGPINSRFQKLRDALGHVGPIVFKGSK